MLQAATVYFYSDIQVKIAQQLDTMREQEEKIGIIESEMIKVC